jgi:hypothetical protein
MDVTPEQRDLIARALYALSIGDDLELQDQMEELWDWEYTPRVVREGWKVKAEDLIERMGWVLTS